MNELKNRGVQDILIAVVDGLKGFPEAITAAFPEATVQTCIVHLVRHSLNFCAWKDRKTVAIDLRRIYGAATAEQAAVELDAFEEKWAGKYASIAPAWRRAWQVSVATNGHGVVIMDGAGWHKSGTLNIPENLSILFLPPYSPELNPVENIWQYLRQTYISNPVFENWDAIVDACCDAWNRLAAETGRIKSIATLNWATIGQ